jgi:hypothetical protein
MTKFNEDRDGAFAFRIEGVVAAAIDDRYFLSQ